MTVPTGLLLQYECNMTFIPACLWVPIILLLKVIKQQAFTIFKQGIHLVFEYAINKIYKKKNNSRNNSINNLSSATCFGFVSHLQARYTAVVLTIYYNAVSGFIKTAW